MKTKTCPKCRVEHDINHYDLKRKGGTQRHGSCKDCRRAYQRDYMQRTSQRSAHLSKTYGISMDDYTTMLEDQGHKCAVCNREETATQAGKLKALAVDHCHTTGRVRGLLCSRCNTFIGQAQENSDHLFSAVMYLRKHSSCKSTA